MTGSRNLLSRYTGLQQLYDLWCIAMHIGILCTVTQRMIDQH
jgi:hypothetical protein